MKHENLRHLITVKSYCSFTLLILVECCAAFYGQNSFSTTMSVNRLSSKVLLKRKTLNNIIKLLPANKRRGKC